MEFAETVRKRFSCKTFDPNYKITDVELKRLFDLVNQGPTSFNLQSTRFIVVRDAARKQELRKLAWNQAQVSDCSAVVCVIGKRNAHDDAAEIYRDVPAAVTDKLLPMIRGFYETRPDLQHDELLRSGSIHAAMLMLAAVDMGYDTCPMVGFDFAKSAAYLGVPANFEMIMMITLGKRSAEPRPRAHRWPLSTLVMEETFGGTGLK